MRTDVYDAHCDARAVLGVVEAHRPRDLSVGDARVRRQHGRPLARVVHRRAVLGEGDAVVRAAALKLADLR